MKLLIAAAMLLQIPQNPSPMVEYTRTHPRLTKEVPAGVRRQIGNGNGTLYVPAMLNGKDRLPLLVFFHGGSWLPEVAAAKRRLSVITVQLGTGSGMYARAYSDPQQFRELLSTAERAAAVRFAPIMLGGWSAGCGAVRQILGTPEHYAKVERVLCIDGLHTDYTGKSEVNPVPMQVWMQLARDAIAGRRQLVITHSEIFPGTFASTTETADFLLRGLGLKRRPVLAWGPMGTQQLSDTRSGRLRIAGYAGNSAPDHVDQLHSLPEYLKWLR
jgi:hypothetical protein